jgi:hypothetical protein
MIYPLLKQNFLYYCKYINTITFTERHYSFIQIREFSLCLFHFLLICNKQIKDLKGAATILFTHIKVKLLQLKYFRLEVPTLMAIRRVLILGCDTMYFGISSPTFQRNVLPPSLWSKSTPNKSSRCLFSQISPLICEITLPPWEILNNEKLSPCCLLDLLFNPKDRSSTFLWNDSQLLPDYMVS